MTIEDLERQGLIKKLPIDKKKIEDAVQHAHNDIKTAKVVLQTDYDWAYTIAYNAILQAGRVLMFSKGYRPDGNSQHISVVKFAGLFLDNNDTIIFDRMRRKRNSSVYESSGTVTENEAEFAVGQSEVLVQKLVALVSP
ncbi:MAG: HEPN domain-containing protein [Methanomicrobiales archaeon]